jgi:hypothetical protein
MPDNGREYTVDGMLLYNCATIIQRDPSVSGKTACDFVPERWLGDSDTSAETDEMVAPGGKDTNQVPASV